MGILDSKSRILDTILTLEGRRQIADGKLKVEWVSLSDSFTFYESDLVSGSTDATQRLFFEASHSPQDQITFEADDSGKLQSFKNTTEYDFKSGKLIKNNDNSLYYNNDFTIVEDETFVSLAKDLLKSSLDNFKNLQLLKTKDKLFEENEFDLGPKDVKFYITDTNPIKDVREQSTSVNTLESFFEDKKLKHIDNFQYLPPVIRNGDSLEPMGDYPVLGPVKGMTYQDLKKELYDVEKDGRCKVINFDPTSNDNKIMLQLFELNKNNIVKLDVIRFGEFNDQEDDNFPKKKVFFLGKILKDDYSNYTFVHIFTLVLER
jgi:hypothetical protein